MHVLSSHHCIFIDHRPFPHVIAFGIMSMEHRNGAAGSDDRIVGARRQTEKRVVESAGEYFDQASGGIVSDAESAEAHLRSSPRWPAKGMFGVARDNARNDIGHRRTLGRALAVKPAGKCCRERRISREAGVNGVAKWKHDRPRGWKDNQSSLKRNED